LIATVDVFLETSRLVGADSRSPLLLVLERASGSTEVCASLPDDNNGDVLAYGIINLVIYSIGLGLVLLRPPNPHHQGHTTQEPGPHTRLTGKIP
jgi:hypothetical protein